MQTAKQNFYSFMGINRDVNPFLMKDSDLSLSINWYSRLVGSKKVRFGYTQLLDRIDNYPVKNLIYYDLPSHKGLLRVSNSKIYKNNLTSLTWGSSVKSLSGDSVDWTVLDGSIPYLHLTNSVDGYMTFDGDTTFKSWSEAFTPKASTIAAWDSRIFADLNNRSLVQSAISFDLNGGYTADPFLIDNNDPSGGGSISADAGHNGSIVKITSSVDRIQVYKQHGAYRYNGSNFMQIPFKGQILSVATSKNQIDYILSSNGISKNDGNSITPADFGINNIIKDTFRVHGITDPVSFSLDQFTIFFIGTIRVERGREIIDIPNACVVHDENIDVWDIWSLGHKMTCFGYYVDPDTNEEVLISGDNNGYTYKWGEQYASDNNVAIAYRLRTSYNAFSAPDASKYTDKFAFSMEDGQDSNVSVAINYTDDYRYKQSLRPPFLTKEYLKGISSFMTLSFQIEGSTKDNRPEFNGYTLKYKDNENSPSEKSNSTRR